MFWGSDPVRGRPMIFVVIGQDGPDGQPLRKRHRAAHLARIEKVNAEGRLMLAGPFSDGTGSLIVFEAASLEEARAWVAADPYVTEGIFVRYEVKPFNPVYPKPQ